MQEVNIIAWLHGCGNVQKPYSLIKTGFLRPTHILGYQQLADVM